MPRSVWAIFCILGLWISSADTCSCFRQHPQQLFCRDDFAILARIRREYVVNDRRIYVIAVRKYFKATDKARAALRTGHIVTPRDSSLCGVTLDVGKMYALTGRIHNLKAWNMLCGNMAIQWKSLTNRQRKGLRRTYKVGCSCKINSCSVGKCKNSRSACNWVSGIAQNCFVKEGVCQRTKSNKCMWTRNSDLSKCKRESYLPFLDGRGRKSDQ